MCSHACIKVHFSMCVGVSKLSTVLSKFLNKHSNGLVSKLLGKNYEIADTEFLRGSRNLSACILCICLLTRFSLLPHQLFFESAHYYIQK